MTAVTLDDLSLEKCVLTRELESLRASYFRAVPEICIERARLVTRHHAKKALLGRERISILDKALVYRRVLEERTPVVWHSLGYERTQEGLKPFAFDGVTPFAGSTTSKYKGVPLYPEFLALAIWPELWTITRRKSNPYSISAAEVEALNFEILPHWIENSLLELTRKRADAATLADFRLFERLVFFLASKPNCISHTIPDFSRAIGEGLNAVIADSKSREAAATDPAKKEFHAAMGEVLQGVIAYARRLADEARRLAESESRAARKSALLDIADVYRRIPAEPAKTFREGLTAVWLSWIACHLENPNVGLSLGRLDQVLYRLYRSDIDAGRMTPNQAVELLCHLWLKIGDHVPMVPSAAEQLFGGTGSNQAITIGGVDRDGRDSVNDLTYVMLRATELMRLRDPNLNARYHQGVNSKEYLRRLCACNVNTGATPALHNDRAVIQALTSAGHTLEEARDYGIVGCVEPGSNGRAYLSSASLLINLTSSLEMALFNGRHRHFGLDAPAGPETGDPATFRTFDDVKAALDRQIRWIVDRAVGVNEAMGKTHQAYYPTPILSAFFEGPMEKGLDVIQGGAKLNGSGVAIIGMADVADSLSAIQRVVFEEKTASFAELLRAIQDDFQGHNPLHVRLMNPEKTPRYGNDDSAADANAAWLLDALNRAFAEKVSYRGGRYNVGFWTMTNHAGFGRLMKAFPSGRRAGESFASGITPVSGVTPTLVKALHSVAKLRPERLSNGIALNLKYTPDDGDPGARLDRFAATVEGYFDDSGGSSGGMEIQFNVTSHDTFADAVAHPENYPDLLVRVSGYTAYFKDLTPQMQKEIIDRTEYRLSSGQAVIYAPFPLPR